MYKGQGGIYPLSMCRCGGASEHDHLTPVTVSKSLHSFIVMERTSVLNAKNPGALKNVLREKYLEGNGEGDMRSECDDQLLINVMFAGTVKVKGIELFGSRKDSGKWPTKLKVYKEAVMVAQEFSLLAQEPTSSNSLPLRYSTRAAKFFNVNSLTLLIEGAADGNGKFIELNYLGFEGEFSQSRVGAVKADYEVKPMLSDHKALETVHSSIN